MSGLKDVFISYGRSESKAFANRLYQRLLKEGLDVWFDQNDIPLGVDFQDQIDDGIERAHSFIFIISPHSVKSAYCLKEILLAVKRGKRIIPILHVEPVGAWQQMHPSIAKRNWVYMREKYEEGKPLDELQPIDDFEQGAKGLVGLIETHHDYVKLHTEILHNALVWQRNARVSEQLLVGSERRKAEEWLLKEFVAPEQPPCEPSPLHAEYITESKKNGENLMTDFFISYSEDDLEMRDRILSALHRKAYTCWVNNQDISSGEDFGEAIDRGIEQADNVLFFISPSSVTSEWCIKELDYAAKLSKRIIPLMVVKTPDDDIPSIISGTQYIDFTDNVVERSDAELDASFFDEKLSNPENLQSGSHGVYFEDNSGSELSRYEKSDFEKDIDQIVAKTKNEAEYYRQHKAFLTQAIRWERQDKTPALLLRGYNLDKARTWIEGNAKRNTNPPIELHQDFIRDSVAKIGQLDTEVFVSYSRKDGDFARKLNQMLQDRGKTTWFDQESIATGEDFQKEIEKGILQSDNFLFVITPDSIDSPFCEDEVKYAASLGKRFVTILHRPIDVDDLPKELAQVQWLDFQSMGLEKGFNALIETLDIDREHVNAHTRYSRNAQEWKERKYDKDLLLRGQALEQAEGWIQTAIDEKKTPSPSDIQQDFIARSREIYDTEQQNWLTEQFEKITMLSRQQEAEAKQKNQARLWFLIPMIIAMVISLGVFASFIDSGYDESGWGQAMEAGYLGFFIFYLTATCGVTIRYFYTRLRQNRGRFYQNLLKRASEYKAGNHQVKLTSTEVRVAKTWIRHNVEKRRKYQLAEVQKEFIEASEKDPAKKRYKGSDKTSPEYIRTQQKKLKTRFFLYTVLIAVTLPIFLYLGLEGNVLPMYLLHTGLSVVVLTIVGKKYWKYTKLYTYYTNLHDIARLARLWETTDRDPSLLLNPSLQTDAKRWIEEDDENLRPDTLETEYIQLSLG